VAYSVLPFRKAAIDQLEVIVYISDVKEKLEIRYNQPPQINLTP